MISTVNQTKLEVVRFNVAEISRVCFPSPSSVKCGLKVVLAAYSINPN